jgi:hypothetical protein
METAARFASRPTENLVDASTLPTPERERALSVTATYLLSEEGRKASLLAGGDGRAVQQITFTVPASRLHLVTVDGNGVARLKLRPRFELDSNQRVVRKDHLPTHDAPPTLDELFRAAARNHQLERAFHAERTAERAKRRETEHGLRAEVARAFLADPSRRALEQPTPTRTYCFLVTERGRHLRFDVSLDEGIARDVPPEAFRRFKSDVRARHADGRQERTRQLSVHDRKLEFIAGWVAKYGTVDQKTRHASGVLSLQEIIEAITEQAFARLNDRPGYVRDGARRLQEHLRQFPAYAEVVVTSDDLAVFSRNAQTATTDQWNLLQEFRASAADADVKLRAHTLMLKRNPDAPPLTLFGVRVTKSVGPFTLQREYAAPSGPIDAQSVIVAADGARNPRENCMN